MQNPVRLNRRNFVKLTALAVGSVTVSAPIPRGLAAEARQGAVDCNVSLFRWPTRRMPDDDTKILVRSLKQHGVGEAWAGSLEGILHKDLGAANDRLARECRDQGKGILIPFGTINPVAAGWEDDFDKCVRIHKMRGIRIYPNYHQYKLDDPRFVSLLSRAEAHKLLVQIPVHMEDERMMHRLLQVPAIDISPLPAALKQVPGCRIILLNALKTYSAAKLAPVFSAGAVAVEIAMLEGLGTVRELLAAAPNDRILFGTNAPLFYVESSFLKLKESALSPREQKMLCADNPIQFSRFA